MLRYIAPGVENEPEYYGTLQAMPNPQFIPAWVVHTFTFSCGAPVWVGHSGNVPEDRTYTLTLAEVDEMIQAKGDSVVLSRIVLSGLNRREKAAAAIAPATEAWLAATRDFGAFSGEESAAWDAFENAQITYLAFSERARGESTCA